MTDPVPAARRTAKRVASSTTPAGLSAALSQLHLGDLLDHVNGVSQAFADAAPKTIPKGGPTHRQVQTGLLPLDNGRTDRRAAR